MMAVQYWDRPDVHTALTRGTGLARREAGGPRMCTLRAMRIPDDASIRALHEKHAPTAEALDLVYTHCQIVCGIAEQLHDGTGISTGAIDFDLDIDLVRAGCLLHDIGVYRLYDESGKLDGPNYIRHGVLGYDLLKEEDLPEAICRFASHHTGVGLTKEDIARQGLPLPPADYLAETGEESLVMYADKFHSKTTPPVLLTPGAYAARVARFGADKAAAFEAMRAEFGDPDLAPFAAAFGHRIEGIGGPGVPPGQALRSDPERVVPRDSTS
jgi:uncharacterized protein